MKELILDNKDLIFSYMQVNAVLLIAMVIGTAVYISRSRLRSRGYSEDYIQFTRKVYFETIPVLGLIFLFSQLILGIFVKLNDPGFTSFLDRKEILFCSLMLSAVCGIFYGKKFNAGYRELAKKTNSPIVIDFNYKLLKLMFNIYLEFPASILTAAFIVLHFDLTHIGLIFMYILFPWLFYLSLRIGKNLNNVILTDQYIQIAGLNIFYQAVLIFLMLLLSLSGIYEFGTYNYVILAIVVVFLTCKLVYYWFNYPKLKKELGIFNNEAV
ncbi:hypothetical protein ACFL4T_06785 [candidate division KSB1 bacterium]